jgi:hypothetical protein
MQHIISSKNKTVDRVRIIQSGLPGALASLFSGGWINSARCRSLPGWENSKNCLFFAHPSGLILVIGQVKFFIVSSPISIIHGESLRKIRGDYNDADYITLTADGYDAYL